MKAMKTLAILAAATTLAASCTDKDKAEARQTLNEAQAEYAKGNYPRTLALIDSLRHNHPKAIEERKEALKLFHASEKMAQADIEKTDRTIQALEAEINRLPGRRRQQQKARNGDGGPAERAHHETPEARFAARAFRGAMRHGEGDTPKAKCQKLTLAPP